MNLLDTLDQLTLGDPLPGFFLHILREIFSHLVLFSSFRLPSTFSLAFARNLKFPEMMFNATFFC